MPKMCSRHKEKRLRGEIIAIVCQLIRMGQHTGFSWCRTWGWFFAPSAQRTIGIEDLNLWCSLVRLRAMDFNACWGFRVTDLIAS